MYERHSGDRLKLDDYFAALAERWRGWDGEIQWEATGMTIAATHDGLGHVALGVEIWSTPDLADKWVLRATLTIEAGSLDRISREAKAADL